LNRHELMLKRF